MQMIALTINAFGKVFAPAALFLLFVSHVYRLLTKKCAHPQSCLILPPIGSGNLGIQALVSTACQQASANGVSPCVITFGDDNVVKEERINARTLVLPGYYKNSKIKIFISLTRFIASCADYNTLLILGCDDIDGSYGKSRPLRMLFLAYIALVLNLKCRIVSTSLSENPSLFCMSALRNLPKEISICARDEFSYHRFSKHFDQKKQVVLAADLALLLDPEQQNPSPACKDLLDKLRRLKSEGKTIIAWNPFSRLNDTPFTDKAQLADYYADCITKLMNSQDKIHLVMVAHEKRTCREQPSDLELINLIAARLPQLSQRMTVSPESLNSSEVRIFTKEISAAISGKFHFAVACFAVGVPVLTIIYQGKVLGLHKQFATPQWCLAPDDLFRNKASLLNMTLALIQQKDAIRTKILESLPTALKLASENTRDFFNS